MRQTPTGWWSDLNPAAQRLARDTILASSETAVAWDRLKDAPFPIHLWVAGCATLLLHATHFSVAVSRRARVVVMRVCGHVDMHLVLLYMHLVQLYMHLVLLFARCLRWRHLGVCALVKAH